MPVLELEVGQVAAGGSCVARHDGRVVFVRHTLPGELVRAQVTEQQRSFWRADAIEVLRAAPERVSAPCRYAGPGQCGGCDWQHVDPAAQRRHKGELVAEQLRGIAKIELPVEVEELAGGPLGWRSRVRFAVDGSGRAGLHPHRSHKVIPVVDCLLLTEAARSIDVLAHRWPAAAAVEVLASTTQGGRAVLVTAHGGRRVRVPELAEDVSVLSGSGGGGARTLRGQSALRETVDDHSFQVTGSAFWQVHPAAAGTLVAAVRAELGPVSGRRVFDLYAGVGLFAAALAADGAEVEAVEADSIAARDAGRNLASLPVKIHRGMVEQVLSGLAPAALAVLDPPRSGAGPVVCAALAQLVEERIVYVSCDAATLARDLAQFATLGWVTRKVRGFDAFPMTAHVECLAVLERVQ